MHILSTLFPRLEQRHAILAIALTSYALVVFDISFVITALPGMQAELGFSATGISWVQNLYTLIFGGLLLLGARATDMLGHCRMYLLGLIFFAGSSLAIGLATSPAWLLLARSLQGMGAAILAPSAPRPLPSMAQSGASAAAQALSWAAHLPAGGPGESAFSSMPPSGPCSSWRHRVRLQRPSAVPANSTSREPSVRRWACCPWCMA